MEPQDALARLAEAGTPPDAPTALKISVGLEERLHRFQNETLPFLAAGGAELQMVFGPYGRGKTHLLWTLQETARRKGLITAYLDCRAEESPFASPDTTYRQISYHLSPPTSPPGTRRGNGIEAVLQDWLSWIPNPTEALKAIQRSPRLASDFRTLVVAYGQSHLRDKHELRGQLGALLSANPTIAVNVRELYQLHPWLPRPLGQLCRRNALAWNRSLASLPRDLGYPGLVLLFDETEQRRVGKKFSQARREHLANLRNMVDQLAAGAFQGCAIIHAVVEDFLGLAREELEALSQRIERVSLDGLVLAGLPLSRHNPRAVWTSLDELTLPGPGEAKFFHELARRLVDLGLEAGLAPHAAPRLLEELSAQAEKHCRSINVGAVRNFVRLAAGQVAFACSLGDRTIAAKGAGPAPLE